MKPQERGIVIVYGILEYNAIFLQFYSWNDEHVNKLTYAKNVMVIGGFELYTCCR